MNFTIVEQAVITAALKEPFNPPAIDGMDSENAFKSEYWEIHQRMADRLRTLGKEDDYGEGDFVMNQDFGFSRFIGIELTSDRMCSQEFVRTLSDTLAEAPVKYRVYVDHDIDHLPLFFLLVHGNDILGCCEDKNVLCRCGFSV